MTVEEALEIIEEMTPCANCVYRNTGCKRKDKHVWCDGFCHTVDEALEIIKQALGLIPDEPSGDGGDDEPNPDEPNPDEPNPDEPEEGGEGNDESGSGSENTGEGGENEDTGENEGEGTGGEPNNEGEGSEEPESEPEELEPEEP